MSETPRTDAHKHPAAEYNYNTRVCNVAFAESLEKENNALRTALAALWQWTKAEVEHFEANTPDDFIVDIVENALKGGR